MPWPTKENSTDNRAGNRWLPDDPLVPGDRWLYRAKPHLPAVEVEILKVGTRRPLRVLIKHVDYENGYDVDKDWVPPNHLKVPWDRAGAWLERDANWARVRSISAPFGDTPEGVAAQYVIECANTVAAHPAIFGVHVERLSLSRQLVGSVHT